MQDDLLMLEIVVAGFPNELSQVPTDNYLLRQRICRMESIVDLDLTEIEALNTTKCRD